MAGKKKATGEQSFAAARARLDEILDELESDAGDVDQLAARVREASELIRFCRERLAGARQEVTEVVAALAADAEQDDGPADVGPADVGPEDRSDDGEKADLPF